jgi:hypothetical protein
LLVILQQNIDYLYVLLFNSPSTLSFFMVDKRSMSSSCEVCIVSFRVGHWKRYLSK